MRRHNTHIVDTGKAAFCGLIFKQEKATFPPMVDDVKTYAEIGERLKFIRTGLTRMNQATFAAHHSFGVTQYSNWENGTRRIPVESAEKLVGVYGLSLDFIYMGRRDGLSEAASKVI